MEKTLVFTHRLELALRLVDTTSGRNISGRDVEVYADEKQIRFQEKNDLILVFQGFEKQSFCLKIRSRIYEAVNQEVDLDQLSQTMPLLELHLIPSKDYPGGTEFLCVEGVLPGIREVSAVRMGDNACLIREFDPRRKMAKIFNPHRLSLERVQYALMDPDNNRYEPFRIVKQIDDQTIKIDRGLEMSFRNYFPITPEVFGMTHPDGTYCLRVRDDGSEAKWLVRWGTEEGTQFRVIDFRVTPHPKLEGGDV